MKLYGLFDYFYDRHEWETLVITSYNAGKLEIEAGEERIAETWEQHNDYAIEELQHYYIKEVKVI